MSIVQVWGNLVSRWTVDMLFLTSLFDCLIWSCRLSIMLGISAILLASLEFVFHYSICVGRCDNWSSIHNFAAAVYPHVYWWLCFAYFWCVFQRMSTGRKTGAYNVAKPNQHQSNTRRYGDQSFSARNLGEDELAGVIFGCTHQTINECLSKQLFG